MVLSPLADRRRRRPCSALAVIALAAVGLLALGGCSKDETALSAGISASASLSPTTAAIGVPVRYEVRVEYSKGMDVEIEDVASSLEGFEINDRGQTARRSLSGITWYRGLESGMPIRLLLMQAPRCCRAHLWCLVSIAFWTKAHSMCATSSRL